jgi:voltage-gated potassium channel
MFSPSLSRPKTSRSSLTSRSNKGSKSLIGTGSSEAKTDLTSLNSTTFRLELVDQGDDARRKDESPLLSMKSQVSRFLAQPVVEVLNGFLVMASSLLVAVSTLNNLPPTLSYPIQIAQDMIAVLFVFEFFLRWFSSPSPRFLYLAQPLVLVDIMVVFLPFLVGIAPSFVNPYLPAWLTSSSTLINLRLLRILRLQRVLTDQATFARFERALGIPSRDIKGWQLQLARVSLSIFTLLSVATGLIYTAEHRVNPNINSYFDALYFGLTTLTTVGFGDVVPMSWQGKLIVSGSILAGVAIIPGQAAELIEALLQRQRENNAERGRQQRLSRPSTNSSTPRTSQMVLETALACSNCGASMHWSTAEFCWSCGNRLYEDHDDDDKIHDEDV